MFERTADGRFFFPKIEFYITNVCNLTCEHCNRFNDFNFRGWQRWSDYEAHYAEWAKYVDFGHITILGGEPLLNPTIVDWVLGINRLWEKPVQILTNGTRLNQVDGLYDLMLGDLSVHPEVQKVYQHGQQRNHIGISWHNSENIDELDQQVRKFLRGPVFRDTDHGMKKYGNAYSVWNDQEIYVAAWIQDNFEHSSIQRTPQGLFLHNNDPKEAHDACTFVQNKNYHFIRGSLYKCGPVALLPEFDQQHLLEISDDERALLKSYVPLTSDRLSTDIQSFLNNIDSVIPQCRFCPVQKDQRKIYAVTKHSKKIMINTVQEKNY